MPMQNLTTIEPKLLKLLEYKSKNGKFTRSLSGMFKSLRSYKGVNLIGDYPLLSFILMKTKEKYPKHKWTNKQIITALTPCKFWKEEGRKQKYIPKDWRKYIKS